MAMKHGQAAQPYHDCNAALTYHYCNAAQWQKDTVGVGLQVEEHAVMVVTVPSQYCRIDFTANDIHRSRTFGHLYLTLPRPVKSDILSDKRGRLPADKQAA